CYPKTPFGIFLAASQDRQDDIDWTRHHARNLNPLSCSFYGSYAMSLSRFTTPPQIFEIGKCPIKMYLKHHEGQIEDILNYLDELYLHHIEKIKEGRMDRMIIRRNSDELKTKLKKIRTQIIKLQKQQLGQNV
ncbi:hypothetical protein Tco_0039900, partial [Tanacetum coccineum]